MKNNKEESNIYEYSDNSTEMNNKNNTDIIDSYVSEPMSISDHPLYSILSENIIDISTGLFLEYNECKRDGNCLYYAVVYQMIRHRIKIRDINYKEKIEKYIKNHNHGDIMFYEDYLDTFTRYLVGDSSVIGGDAHVLIDSGDFNDIIVILKILMSVELLGDFSLGNFIECSLEEYSKRCILPFYRESGEIELLLISRVLGVIVEVLSVVDPWKREIGESCDRRVRVLYTYNHFEPIN